jgi:hypothetical protein
MAYSCIPATLNAAAMGTVAVRDARPISHQIMGVLRFHQRARIPATSPNTR